MSFDGVRFSQPGTEFVKDPRRRDRPVEKDHFQQTGHRPPARFVYRLGTKSIFVHLSKLLAELYSDTPVIASSFRV